MREGGGVYGVMQKVGCKGTGKGCVLTLMYDVKCSLSNLIFPDGTRCRPLVTLASRSLAVSGFESSSDGHERLMRSSRASTWVMRERRCGLTQRNGSVSDDIHTYRRTHRISDAHTGPGVFNRFFELRRVLRYERVHRPDRANGHSTSCGIAHRNTAKRRFEGFRRRSSCRNRP